MRRLLVALSVLTAAASHAQAAPRDPAVVRKGCGYEAVAVPRVTASGHELGNPDSYTAVLYGYAVAENHSDPPNPAGLTVRCYVAVDWVEQASTPAVHGSTLAATGGPVTFHATADQDVAVCVEVVLDGGGTEVSCGESAPIGFPPQEILDAVDGAVRTVDAAVDPVLCPLLGAIAPGVPGLVDVAPSGDVTVEVTVNPPGIGGLVYDCP
jgi:hypothetical protein